MRPEPPESNLHFIRDANSARCTHALISSIEIARGKNNLPGDARQGLSQKRRDLPSSDCVFDNHISHSLRILRANPRFATFIWPAIVIRNWRDVNPRLTPTATRPVKFIRAQIDQRRRMPVICVLEHNHVFPLRVRTRQT